MKRFISNFFIKFLELKLAYKLRMVEHTCDASIVKAETEGLCTKPSKNI